MNDNNPASVDASPGSISGLSATLNRSPRNTLVLMAQDLSHWYVAELAASAYQTALNQGFQLITLDFHRSPERERALLQVVAESQVAGCIFLWDYCEANLDLYAQIAAQCACVQIGDPKPIPQIDHLKGDDYAGALLAMTHLIDLGYRQIGHVTLTPPIDSVAQRRKAYVDALQHANLPQTDSWCLELPYGLTQADRERRRPDLFAFLTQPQRPRALFVCADWLASEVIECAQELGLHIPNDVALVGYDDALPYALTSVPLTTVRVDLREVGKLAVERLLTRIQEPMRADEPGPSSPLPTLVVRASSVQLIPTSERWDFVMRYVQDHFREQLSVTEIAAQFGFDANYFSHRFTQIFGKRFTEHVNQLRLESAAQLLLTTNHTIEHIAASCGFQSANYFYRLFRRAYATSPHAFRRQQTFR